jgi:predicted porin
MSSSGQFMYTGTRSVARQRLLAVLAGGCLGFAGTAAAETEVTLYGEIDTGLKYTSSVSGDEPRDKPPRGHSRLAATSNSVGGSFFGLHGTEDLGGGLKAEFTIERGIDVTNGTGSDGQPMFVGLSHPQAGTLTLGRQFDSTSDYLAPLTLTGSEGAPTSRTRSTTTMPTRRISSTRRLNGRAPSGMVCTSAATMWWRPLRAGSRPGVPAPRLHGGR